MVGSRQLPQAMSWRRKKPAPDIYNLAIQQLGVTPQRAIAFEDSAIGVRAAKAAGLFTVATPSLWTIGQDFTAADVVLTSLADPERPLYATDELRIARSTSDWINSRHCTRPHYC